jgi:hypothetical protein
VLTKTFAFVEVMSDAGQVATAQAPKVEIEEAKLVVLLPPMMTPPALVVVAFEFKRIWPPAESKFVLFRLMSPLPFEVRPVV